uniref:Uncharacterized protein n=1 Tax=Pseudo-nitzschia delicatissima TaxID=44447 RepID=A0A7S0TDX0_9STRA
MVGVRMALLRQRGGLPLFQHGFATSRDSNRMISRRFLVTGTNDKDILDKQERPSLVMTGGNTTPTSTEAAAASAEELLDASFAAKLSKAKIHKQSGGHSGIFPWRSSPDLHERLIPGTDENYSKGLLLGGNLTSSNPKMDGFATACFFLRISFWDMLLFRNSTEQDMADSMAWAFGAAVKEITEGRTIDDKDQEELSSSRLKEMMEEQKLAKLFESATEFGRESLEVKLETTPILYNENFYEQDIEIKHDTDIIEDLPMGLRDGPKIVSLFVFPFLSRQQIKKGDPHHLRKYSKLLDAISASNDENDEAADTSYMHSMELSRDLMEDFRRKGISENTVVCQVLVPCLETFWVKDTNTGKILQGDANQRTVVHLVRFEQTTKTHIVQGSDKTNDSMSSRFFPFRHELGQWKITDIDDLCDGNLLL